jgi:hypothetical protein
LSRTSGRGQPAVIAIVAIIAVTAVAVAVDSSILANVRVTPRGKCRATKRSRGLFWQKSPPLSARSGRRVVAERTMGMGRGSAGADPARAPAFPGRGRDGGVRGIVGRGRCSFLDRAGTTQSPHKYARSMIFLNVWSGRGRGGILLAYRTSGILEARAESRLRRDAMSLQAWLVGFRGEEAVSKEAIIFEWRALGMNGKPF